LRNFFWEILFFEEKLEGYQEEAKKGKELNKDQKEALAKYSDVLGQIECVKELNEQFKKIQIEVCLFVLISFSN
jgi:hypothetical protein